MDDRYTGLLGEIRKIPVIDTHEHMPHGEEVRDRDTDVLKEYLTHYLSSDLVSAGLSPSDLNQARDHRRPLRDRWALVEPFWEASRHTGYGRALDISAREIYGIEGVRGDTIEVLDAAFRAGLAPGHYKRVLKDLCGIERSILDGFFGGLACDREFFRRVWQPLHASDKPSIGRTILATEREQGIRVRTLDDWMEAFRRELDGALAQGIVALKCILAYHRSLRFEDVPYAVARDGFRKAVEAWEKRGRKEDDGFGLPAAVQDHIVHSILRTANERRLVVQFHTGLQEGNGNVIANSDPSLMSNLFLKYPDVDFDLFHIGWPYQDVTAALCKVFPNVTIDMCWAHIISPSDSRRALDAFLDCVPYNKISAFGGDFAFVDGVLGHLRIAQENVAAVLADKVKSGLFGGEEALRIARALFHDNPARIFRL